MHRIIGFAQGWPSENLLREVDPLGAQELNPGTAGDLISQW